MDDRCHLDVCKSADLLQAQDSQTRQIMIGSKPEVAFVTPPWIK